MPIKTVVLLFLIASALASTFEVIARDRPIEVHLQPRDQRSGVMKCDVNKEFSFDKNGKSIADVKNESLHWRVPANISYLRVKGHVSHRSTVNNTELTMKNWRLMFLDNFASGDKNNWQGAMTNVKNCGPSKDKSLFRDCRSKIDYIEKKFTGLGPHTEIMVEAQVHFIDQWEGELAYLQIEQEVVWTKAHNWCHTIFNHRCMLSGVNVCEDAYPDLVGQHLKYVFQHTKPEVTIRFGTSLTKDNCKANWGFNNFMLYAR